MPSTQPLLNWTEYYFLCLVNPKGYKTTGYRTCQQRMLLQNIYKGYIKNVCVKYKHTETIKVLARNINIQENRRLLMNKSDKSAIKEDRWIYPSV